MVRKTLLSVTALALVAMSAHTTFAAEPAASPYGNRPQEIRLDDAYTLPSVFVDKLSASVRGGTVEGDFTVLSEVNDVIGNLQYRIEIYGDLPGQPTNDPQILFAVSKTFDIAPLVSGERRVMKYSYALPSLPEGTFTARIQVLHGGTRELGWANARISVPATAGTFLTTYGESIALPEFEGKGVGALTGPNVDPESDFSVTLGVFNAGGPETVVVPRFTVHRMDMSAPSVSETGFDPLAIPSTDSTITLQVKAPKAPGVYVGALTLEQNGKTVSTIGQYRFVVRGLDADIISARLANVASLKGETAFVRIDMVGPADAETTGKAFMQVSIRDSKGIAGQVTVSDLTLNDGVGMGMAKVTLSRDLASSPDIFVVIKDAEGNVLTESTTSIGLTTTQLETQSNVSVSKLWAAWYLSPAVVFSVFFGLLCLLALLVVLRKIISLRKIPVALQHAFSGTMIVILITTQFSPVFAHGGNNGLEVAAPRTLAENLPFQSGDPAAYTTYWSQVWNRPIVALFINRPIHNSTVDCRQPIPLEFRIEYAACNNIPAAGRVIARFDANGNHQTTLMGTNANWIKVFEDTYIQVPDCGGARACIHTKNYNTNVNLSGLAPNATKTTLQVVVKHNAYVDAGHGVPDDTINTNDVYFQRRFAQAFNLHLNCAAVCGNTVTETGEQCDDGNQNPNDACNNQCQRTRCGDNIIQRPNGNGQQEECDDGNTTNNDGCSNICELETADIEITKTSNKQNIEQNETFTYNLLVKNNGPTQARDVVVTDTIPAVLTITSLPATCTANGNAVTCNLGDLSSGATRSLNIGIRAPASGTCPLTINNRAVVTTTSRDTNSQNNASTATIDMACVPTDVTITKTAPASFVNDAANTFNYTITAINNTAASALNVVVTDPIPAGLTINSAPGCTIAGQNLTCAVGTLAANATRQFTVSVTAAARTVCAQSRTNTATVSTSTPETNPNNNQASATTSFTCTPLQTDIRIVKTAPATINNDTAGTFNYVLAVTNLTATPATNVVVTDAIPAPINIAALPGGCSQNGGTVQCNLGTLAGNATVTITIPVSIAARAACGQSIPNTATVQTSTPDTNNGNNQSTASTNFTCTPPTDIEVVKTAPATLNNDAVNNFNYVITLRNLTTSAAQNVSLSDNIPPSLTITSVPAGCSANGNAINCPVGVLAANATRSFTIGVSAAARSVCSQTVTNTASATTSTIETNQNNNQSSAQTAFTCTPQTDIRISKTAPATVSNDAASPFTYTIAVANTTSTPAANVVITDAIPSTLSITSLPAGCSANGNAVTCSVGTLAGNATRQYVIGVSAAARTVCSQTVTNTANVTTTTQDTNSQNNQASAQTNFTCTPITDIEITKSAPATVSNDAASPFNYTLTVRNLTANAAANVVVTDNIHGALVITSVPAGCSANGNAVTCSIGTLAANATRTLVIGVSAAARTVCSQAILNTTSVTTTTPESSTQNNESSAQTAFTCTPQTDVTITKTAPVTLSNDAVAPFNYTLTARNNTTVSAANVVVTDTIPQPLTVTSVPAGCSANGNTVTCNVGTLAGNATRQYVIGVSAAARAVCAQTVTNTAFISTTTQETNANNNQASAQTNFTCTTPQTDVRIVKTAPTALTNNAASPFNYTLTVTNLTANAAANVIVTDTIPAQLTVTSLPAGCARTGNAVTCTVGTLAGNASREFVIGVSAAANTVCNLTLTNTANVTTTTPENNTANNQSSAQTSFTCPSQQTDVTITKTAPATLSNDALSSFNYTITATNTTTVSAASVIVTDAIPEPLTITTLPAGCTANGNAVTCTVGTLAGNQSRQFVIGVSAAARTVCAQTVTNTAYVTTTTPETNPGNNQASAQTNFTCTTQQTDISIVKTGPSIINVVDLITYRLSVTNNGPARADTIVIRDVIPAGLVFQPDVSESICHQVGNAIECPLDFLSANQTRGVTVRFRAGPTFVCGGAIHNTATVTTVTPETNLANNQSSLDTQVPCPSLSIEKTAPATSTAGGNITYSFRLRNTSTTQTAQDVVTSDWFFDTTGRIVPPFTFVSSSLGAACSYVPADFAVSCNFGTLNPGQEVNYTLTFSIPNTPQICNQTVMNQVDAWPGSDRNNAAWDKAQTVVQCPAADVTITKTAPATLSNDTVSNFNYTISAINTSTVAADNVVISDTIPQPLTITSLPAGCSANGNTVTCNVGTLAANTSRQYLIGVSAAARAVCSQTVTNYTYITTSTQETNPNNNQASAQTAFTCTQQTDISITKTAPASLSNDTASAFNYTLTVQNNTTVAADNIVITDAIPGTLTVTSVPAGCSANGNTVTCNVGTLAGNQSRQYVIGVSAAARAVCSQTITNTASVTTSTFDTNSQNNQSFAQTVFTCTQTPRLYITKAGPATVTAGSMITYTFTLQNTSAFTATNVNVYDYFIDQNAQKLLPAPFTFVSSNGLTCQYDTADQRVECNPIDLAANQTISFTMTFSVPNTQAICNQVVTNKAETIAGTNQQTLDTDTVATTVQCPPPQFTIVKNGPASVTPGELLTYIITATNTGPTAQNNIQFVDDVPAGLTFEPNGSTIGCSETAGKIYCPAQTFQPGQTVSYTLKFRANQNIACNSSIYNEAKLAFNGTPFITSNRTQTTVQCTPPKLDITKSAPPTINIGGTITYSFSLRNTSATQTATEVELYDFNINAQGDPLMPYFTFQSISLGSCDPLDSQGRIHCNLPSLAPNQVVNFTMTFVVPNNQNLCGITVINQVDVWTQRDIANTDWDKAMTTVQCAPTDADVSIVKSGPVSVNRGSNITYSLVVSNAGPATATNVVTHDQIPAGLTFVSASGASCSQVNGSIDCTIGSLAVGAPQTILLNFSTQAPGQSCTPGSVQNVATVTATTTDTNMANNQSQVFTSLTCPQNLTADVSVVKTGPATVVRGNQIAYSIIVSNSGPSTATGINITDVVPSGFTYVGATGATCAVTGNQSQVSCNIGTLNSGASANIVLTFSVPAMPQNCTQSIATNTVSVTSATTDPNLGNNSSSAVTTVTCPQDLSADIAVMKFGPSTIVRGNQITYSLVVTNYGPGAAQGVTLSDPIPQGLTFVSSSGGQCSVVGSTLTCTIGTLPSGQSSPIITATFLAPTIQACVPSSVTNTATITATTQDPQLGNNSASAITAITCPAADTADLSIVKTGTVTAQYGAQVTYSLNVTNNGPSSVDNVTVSDTFPAGLTYVSVTGATCQLALPANSPTIGGILSCDVGTLASGAQKNIQFVFSTAVPAQCSQATVINNATVSEADPNVTDSNSANNQSSASTTLTCPNTSTDLSITKTGQSTVVRGSSSTYTIVVTNNGPSTATNVVMTDTFSSEYTYSSASGATCNVNGSVLTCTIGTMSSGQSVTITAIFTAKTQSNTCSTATVTNTASVGSDTLETNPGNNFSSAVTTQLTCPTADISVYKTDNRSTANVLDRLRYSIIITNNSSTAATNLLVTDNVPYDLTILTVSDGGTVSSQQVRWTDISVPANSSRTLYIDAEVKSGVANGTVVRNTVDVNGKSATDDTTIYNNTTVNPPYYPPYNPPIYQPPYNPPVYYPPVQNPPVYYPPVQNPPQVIYPQTGDNAVDLYAAKIDTASVTQVTPVATQDDNGFSAVFYATLIALLAVGSAAATRFVSFGL